MTEENLEKLTINYLTDEQYNKAKENGELNENELYCTPEIGNDDEQIYNLNIPSGISVGTSETSIPFQDVEFKGLSIKNGVIEIGKDINLIRFCSTISIQNSTSTGGQRRLNLKKNSDVINVVYTYANNATYNNGTFVLNTIIEVNEGDKISLSTASTSGNCIILNGTYASIYIEKLK